MNNEWSLHLLELKENEKWLNISAWFPSIYPSLTGSKLGSVVGEWLTHWLPGQQGCHHRDRDICIVQYMYEYIQRHIYTSYIHDM